MSDLRNLTLYFPTLMSPKEFDSHLVSSRDVNSESHLYTDPSVCFWRSVRKADMELCIKFKAMLPKDYLLEYKREYELECLGRYLSDAQLNQLLNTKERKELTSRITNGNIASNKIRWCGLLRKNITLKMLISEKILDEIELLGAAIAESNDPRKEKHLATTLGTVNIFRSGSMYGFSRAGNVEAFKTAVDLMMWRYGHATTLKEFITSSSSTILGYNTDIAMYMVNEIYVNGGYPVVYLIELMEMSPVFSPAEIVTAMETITLVNNLICYTEMHLEAVSYNFDVIRCLIDVITDKNMKHLSLKSQDGVIFTYFQVVMYSMSPVLGLCYLAEKLRLSLYLVRIYIKRNELNGDSVYCSSYCASMVRKYFKV